MKKLLILLPVLFMALSAAAQDSWTVVLHKKVIFTGKIPDEGKNVKLIRPADWKKNGYLEVRFKEGQPSSWHHSLRFTDENGQELYVKDSSLDAKIATQVLRRTFAGKKQIKIYMMIAPTDPLIMTPARRIHLVTLKFS